MSEQGLLTTEPEGLSAQLQERVRSFTAFYEQHAYLAYNLALRITCEPNAAERAVRRGFLCQLDAQPAGLVPEVVAAALREPPADCDPAAAGDEDAQRLLIAGASLPAPERAAVALAELAHAGPDGIAEALRVPSDQAAKVLHRGREAFAAALGVSRTQADAAVRDWMWAAPPNDIWEALYPDFHRTVERQLRRGPVEHTLVLRPDPRSASAGPSRRRRPTTLRPRRFPPRFLRRARWSIVLPVLAVALAAGAVGIARLDGTNPDTSAPPGERPTDARVPGVPVPDDAASGKAGVKPHKPLTAELLDKLRLRELRQLRAYGRRQVDSSLPARQRRAAARRVAALERAARARLRAQRKREAAIRDREARERARAQAPPPPAPAPRRTSPRPSPEKPKTETTSPASPPRNREEADRTCLQDQDTGQYICPN